MLRTALGPAIARFLEDTACESAWGPGADRRHKRLIDIDSVRVNVRRRFTSVVANLLGSRFVMIDMKALPPLFLSQG
jgi:hypothetical protein